MTPQQIDAIKLALEVMRNQGDVSVDEWIATEKAIEEALAEHAMQEVQRLGQEIEQEPVGRFTGKFTVDAHDRMLCEVVCTGAIPTAGAALYTTPLQRKPLTHEQIFACENSVPDEIVSDRDWCIHFARAIESAHGIKENT